MEYRLFNVDFDIKMVFNPLSYKHPKGFWPLIILLSSLGTPSKHLKLINYPKLLFQTTRIGNKKFKLSHKPSLEMLWVINIEMKMNYVKLVKNLILWNTKSSQPLVVA